MPQSTLTCFLGVEDVSYAASRMYAIYVEDSTAYSDTPAWCDSPAYFVSEHDDCSTFSLVSHLTVARSSHDVKVTYFFFSL
jgi:hypothetical protein